MEGYRPYRSILGKFKPWAKPPAHYNWGALLSNKGSEDKTDFALPKCLACSQVHILGGGTLAGKEGDCHAG